LRNIETRESTNIANVAQDVCGTMTRSNHDRVQMSTPTTFFDALVCMLRAMDISEGNTDRKAMHHIFAGSDEPISSEQAPLTADAVRRMCMAYHHLDNQQETNEEPLALTSSQMGVPLLQPLAQLAQPYLVLTQDSQYRIYYAAPTETNWILWELLVKGFFSMVK
jgi:hypothetical protein